MDIELLRERHEIIKDMFSSTPIKICFDSPTEQHQIDPDIYDQANQGCCAKLKARF